MTSFVTLLTKNFFDINYQYNNIEDHKLGELPSKVIISAALIKHFYFYPLPLLLLHTLHQHQKNFSSKTLLTSAAVNRCFGLYFTSPSTSPISSRVVKLGKIFSHSSRLLLGNLLLMCFVVVFPAFDMYKVEKEKKHERHFFPVPF